MAAFQIEKIDSLDAIRDEWSALPLRSVFSTWDWVDAWWTHFGRERPLLVHTIRTAAGELSGVLPLYLWRPNSPTVLRFLGHPQGDELGPLPTGAPGLAESLEQALSRIRHDVFLGEQLPGEEDWPRRLGGRRWRIESSPVLRFRGTWEDYVSTRSPNLRDQLRRRERRLRERYDVAMRLCDEPGRLDRALDVLFALHRDRWGAASGFAPEPFHREVARRALDRGWLRLWVLELDGRPTAAWYGFRVGNVESYYQAGRDTAFDSDSVGFVLLAHTMRAALEDGVDEYRFLRGPETYKSRFADSDPGLETVVLPRTPIGRLAVAGGFAARPLRNLARRPSREGR
jgi:CelD/BcsL family acetyltransferase involved in cellulose biosynthesis